MMAPYACSLDPMHRILSWEGGKDSITVSDAPMWLLPDTLRDNWSLTLHHLTSLWHLDAHPK